MKAIVQRVREAGCEVNGELITHIGKGVLVFLGIEKGDSIEKAQKLAYKCVHLRIFEDTEGKMNLSVKDIAGEILVISQFTLCANCDKGLRPSFDNAEVGTDAITIYNSFIDFIHSNSLKVKQGIFGSKMHIPLVNDGPATFILTI
ncbi:MAG: D-tyrosyl-tRNA(Tyr) deacylase [Candidatus Stahlbacteria bacterium]|nr:D-tyrosyl-tRNA(Tyr) deacylase [Candidatus Stahlbacteria bacterium]